MRKWGLIILMGLAALGIAVFTAQKTGNNSEDRTGLLAPDQMTQLLLEKPSGWIVAAGRVEPASEAIDLSFELNGIIDTILVKEGDAIASGQVLAILKSGDREARLEGSKAELEAKRASHEKLVTGARKEEKSEAWTIMQQAKIDMNNAKTEAERRKQLLRQQLIAEEEVDRSITKYKVSQNQFEEARQRYLITLTQSRKEDIQKAFSELQAAHAKVDEMNHELEKTRLRSPISGTVLRRHMRPGERVSLFLPNPVLTIGDISTLHVRAEILEKDIAHARIGSLAYVTTEAFAGRRFEGIITHVTPEMGEKAILSEKPDELLDRKILEVLVRLKSPQALIPGLDVDVFIATDNATAPQ